MIVSTDWQPAPYPTETPLYALTDIHGQAHLLEQLHGKLHELLDNHSVQSSVIHLGDYMDRGPENFRTLDMIFDFDHPNAKNVILPGNHEWIMLQFIDEPKLYNLSSTGKWWENNGGSCVFKELDEDRYESFMTLREMLVDNLGERLQQIRNLPTAYRDGNYFFVHAGVPKMYWQNVDKTLWIDWKGPLLFEDVSPIWVRDPFLSNRKPYPDTIVVHGHTPTHNGKPDVRKNRINIDTGAFSTGKLTMLEIVKDQMRFHIAE